MLEEIIDSDHLTELIARDNLPPPLWVRMVCQQIATLSCGIFNALRKEGTAAYPLKAFLPWKTEIQEQSVEEMAMVCEAMSMQTFGDE